MSSRAPSTWSTATLVICGSALSTATTGRSGGSARKNDAAAEVSGTISTSPSTDWSTSRCTAWAAASEVDRRRLATLTL